jgi:hypothetical protein
MSVRATLACAGLIMGMLFAPAFTAFADEDIIVSEAPPPPRVETVPAPRSGFVWSPGYWAWENGEHTWHEGRWVEVTKPHQEAQWVPDHWEQRDETHWHFVSGHWKDVD